MTEMIKIISLSSATSSSSEHFKGELITFLFEHLIKPAVVYVKQAGNLFPQSGGLHMAVGLLQST